MEMKLTVEYHWNFLGTASDVTGNRLTSERRSLSPVPVRSGFGYFRRLLHLGKQRKCRAPARAGFKGLLFADPNENLPPGPRTPVAPLRRSLRFLHQRYTQKD